MYDKVLELLKEKNYSELKKLLSDMNEADIASILTDVPEETLPLLYRILPKELAAGLIRYFRGRNSVLINRDANVGDDEFSLVIHGKVGEVLGSLVV